MSAHAFRMGDSDQLVNLSRRADGYRLQVGDQLLSVGLTQEADGSTRLHAGDRRMEVVIAVRGDEVFIHLDGETHQLRYRHPLDRLAAQAQAGAGSVLRAPMPGSLVSLAVAAGDVVTRGQVLLVMESMKMETSIIAPRDGVVAAVKVEKGQSFDRDAVLVELEPLRESVKEPA